jgi:hypothetical protein
MLQHLPLIINCEAMPDDHTRSGLEDPLPNYNDFTTSLDFFIIIIG